MASFGPAVNSIFEQHILDLMSGRNAGISARTLRALLRAAEPFYSMATRTRNTLFDLGLKASRGLDRPAISIGNITTGGTGKTPVVRWLAEQLRTENKRVAILSRGYRSNGRGMGDELSMLDRALNTPDVQRIFLQADPDRYRGGTSLLHAHPEIELFLLDDGFQHRALHRDLDLVLVSAIEPFGYGHVLPRGLLREPLEGLKRAGSIVITHADQLDGRSLDQIESVLRRYHLTAPIYRAAHAPARLLSSELPDGTLPMDELSRRPFFAFCGIGSPASFENPLRRFGDKFVGHGRFGDHHSYRANDLNRICREAKDLGAELLITTEKDWIKIAKFTCDLPIWRIELRVQFLNGGAEQLLTQIRRTITLQGAQ
jgi:tetraacyldisaccharide 4'-kinase